MKKHVVLKVLGMLLMMALFMSMGFTALAQANTDDQPSESDVGYVTYVKKVANVSVTAVTHADAFGEPVELSVVPLPESTRDYKNTNMVLINQGLSFDELLVYDISFVKEGTSEEIEPAGDVKVFLSVDNLCDVKTGTVSVTHIGREGIELVADDATGTLYVDGQSIDAVFEVESLSPFAITWTNEDDTTGQANVYWGTPDGDAFNDFDAAKLDTTAATVSLANTYDGYVFVGAYYKTADGTEVDIADPVLTKTANGWTCTALIHNADETTTKETRTIPDGAEIYAVYAQKGSGNTPGPSGEDVQGPETQKEVTDNGDGTYTIRLEVTAPVVEEISQTGANVLLVLDTTYSMASSMQGAANRFEAARSAALTLIDALDCDTNDIELALVEFNATGSIKYDWTDNHTVFRNYIQNTAQHANGPTGTNWESGLYYARQVLNNRDGDNTYVIFLTDGEPNRRGTTSSTNATTANAISYALTQAQAITALDNTSLYGVFCGSATGYNNLNNMINNAGGVQTINGTDSTTINNAFSQIAQTIIENLGSSNVSVDDGIPSLSNVSAAVSGEASGFKYEIKAPGETGFKTWADAPGASYSQDNGVTWDLSKAGTLAANTTYAIEFTVWPSQAAYDRIADLNNGLIDPVPSEEDLLKEGIAKDASGKYYLLTNTHLNTTYTFNGKTYTDPGEWESKAMELPTETITVEKIWNNALDGRTADSVILSVTKDEETYIEEVPVSGPTWKSGEIFISCGQIRTTSDGYEVLEKGHDYEVIEPEEYAYYWELTSEVYRPMVINGQKKVLILDDDATGTDGVDYYVIEGHKYVEKEGSNALQAVNDRRSFLQLEKKVTGTGAPADTLFEFTITIDDANKEDIWFSAFDPTISGDDKTVKDLTTSATAEVKDGANTGYYYAASGSSFTIKIKAGWTVRFINLPTGTEYTFEETTLPDGFAFEEAEGRVVDHNTQAGHETPEPASISGMKAEGTINVPNSEFYVDYSNKYETTQITVTKRWDDAGNQDGIRPNETTFAGYISLLVNGTASTAYDANRTITDNKDNTYTITYTNLPKYINNEVVEYKISESAIDKYTTTGSPAANGGEIKNSYTPATVDIPVEKIWDDGNNQDGLRPDSVTINLFANGEDTGKTLTLPGSDGSWKGSFTGLPKNSAGTPITYTITETKVTGYQDPVIEGDAATGFKVTNKHVPDVISIPVEKVWDDSDDTDGLRPDSVMIKLFANDEDTGKTLTLPGSDGSWKGSFTGLPKKAAGQDIAYTIEEVPVTGYETEIVGSASTGFTVTNKHVPETISIPVEKVWEDEEDYDGLRPDSVTVRLLANGEDTGKTIELKADDWTGEFANLLMNKDGQEIQYTVEEVPVEKYSAEIEQIETDDGGIGFVIINTHEPEKVEVSGQKTWDDNDDKAGARPTQITVNLLADGKKIDSVTVTENDDWAYSFTELDKYNDGKEIVYTVEEEPVPRYTTTVTGFNIKNTYHEEVKTGDTFRMLPFVILMSVSGLAALGLLTWVFIRRKQTDNVQN